MTRKAPLVIIGTAAGLAGILSYHTHATKLAAGSTTGSGGSSSTLAPSSGSSGSSSTTVPSSGSSGSSGAPPTTSPAAGPVSGSQTATGPTVQYGYGQLAVRVTLSGGRIASVSVPTLQVADYTSQYIAQQAFPLLKREVLSVQSANIQGVSGATYTSEAYARSLQSALTKAKQG